MNRQMPTAMANQYQWLRHMFQMSLMLSGSSLLGTFWGALYRVSIFEIMFFKS